MNKKENYIVNWKEMPIEDKAFLCLEYICYLLMVGTLVIVIFAIAKDVILNAIIIFVTGMGFVACGLSARSTRDSFLKIHIPNFKTITNYQSKRNKHTSFLIKKI